MKKLNKFIQNHGPHPLGIIAVTLIALILLMGETSDCKERTEWDSREEKLAAESITVSTVDLEFKEVRPAELLGLFGVIEHDTYYPYARVPAVDSSEMHDFWVTVYGPPQFPQTNNTARWYDDENRITVSDYLDWSYDLGLDGIVAVSPGYPDWYNRIRDEMPPVIRISGHDEADGIYLCVDRMNDRFWNHLDIWVANPHPGGTYFSEPIKAMEVNLTEAEL